MCRHFRPDGHPVFRPDLSTLPLQQLAYWSEHAADVPRGFVLYGGTAIALRHGHRPSVDFDWFSSATGLLPKVERYLARFPGRRVLQQDARMLAVSIVLRRRSLKLSFFEGLKFGRVGTPAICENGVLVASSLDLLATKLKVLQERMEAKDYLDID